MTPGSLNSPYPVGVVVVGRNIIITRYRHADPRRDPDLPHFYEAVEIGTGLPVADTHDGTHGCWLPPGLATRPATPAELALLQS